MDPPSRHTLTGCGKSRRGRKKHTSGDKARTFFNDLTVRVKRVRKNAVFFASRLSGGGALVHGRPDDPSFLLFRRLPNTLRPEHYTAGTSFTIRTRLCAAAARRKIQSTRRRPR